MGELKSEDFCDGSRCPRCFSAALSSGISEHSSILDVLGTAARIGPNSVEPGLLRNNEAREFGRDMKVSEVLRMLHNDGWYMIATKGSIVS
jgi:hypothetical protein